MAREGGGVCHPSALLGRERVGCPVRCASGPFERAGQGCTGWREGSGQGGIGGCERRHRCPKLDGLSYCLPSPKGSTVPVVSPIPPFATTGTVSLLGHDDSTDGIRAF